MEADGARPEPTPDERPRTVDELRGRLSAAGQLVESLIRGLNSYVDFDGLSTVRCE
jgi:hypothetical protein